MWKRHNGYQPWQCSQWWTVTRHSVQLCIRKRKAVKNNTVHSQQSKPIQHNIQLQKCTDVLLVASPKIWQVSYVNQIITTTTLETMIKLYQNYTHYQTTPELHTLKMYWQVQQVQAKYKQSTTSTIQVLTTGRQTEMTQETSKREKHLLSKSPKRKICSFRLRWCPVIRLWCWWSWFILFLRWVSFICDQWKQPWGCVFFPGFLWWWFIKCFGQTMFSGAT